MNLIAMPRRKTQVQPQILSTSEVAAILGVTVQQVGRLLKAGKMPNARQLGRDWAILASDLDSFKRTPRGRPKIKPETK